MAQASAYFRNQKEASEEPAQKPPRELVNRPIRAAGLDAAVLTSSWVMLRLTALWAARP